VLARHIERFPSWLRIVATTRRDPAVLQRLSGLRALRLDAQDPRNLEDIREYVNRRLAEAPLRNKLEESRRSVEAVREQLCSKSDGNFLFLREAFRGIERGLYDFARLEELPPGLNGLYLWFFERQFPTDTSWEDAQRVLEVVVAAQEPFTVEQLARATHLDRAQAMPRLLGRLAAYLPERGGHHALYHQSLKDWLLSDPRYCLDRKRAEQRLVEHCQQELEAYGSSAAIGVGPLPEGMRYAIRFYGAHLDTLQSPPAPFAQLVTRRWYDLCLQATGIASGFLEDVKRAWRSAQRANEAAVREGKPAPFLALEVRCALCQASVQSLSRSLPIDVVIHLVRRGRRTPEQALEEARHLLHPNTRIQGLVALADGGGRQVRPVRGGPLGADSVAAKPWPDRRGLRGRPGRGGPLARQPPGTTRSNRGAPQPCATNRGRHHPQ
jgi:hypothetical protein